MYVRLLALLSPSRMIVTRGVVVGGRTKDQSRGISSSLVGYRARLCGTTSSFSTLSRNGCAGTVTQLLIVKLSRSGPLALRFLLGRIGCNPLIFDRNCGFSFHHKHGGDL